jgi:transcriptional regulator of acetoin/glycerol metabolism
LGPAAYPRAVTHCRTSPKRSPLSLCVFSTRRFLGRVGEPGARPDSSGAILRLYPLFVSEDPTAQSGTLSPIDATLPGFVVLWSGDAPRCNAHHVTRKLVVGRSDSADVTIEDQKLSRKHVAISHVAGGFLVEDLGSKHGTFVDGVRIAGARAIDDESVVRVGETILLLRHDVSAHLFEGTKVEKGSVMSPYLREVWKLARSASMLGLNTLILGGTGTGKERVARWFHESGPRKGATFVELAGPDLDPALAGLALFGSRRGAFTGAVDREGLIERAHGGTLYIDEFGDVPGEVQSKLLRVLQEKVVARLGGDEARTVDFVLVVATKVELEQAIQQGKFRNDLRARVAQMTIELEPLAHRRDEIPFLLATHPKLVAADGKLSAGFVEECMVREWPENIRDLHNALTNALVRADVAGRKVLGREWLRPRAAMWKAEAPDAREERTSDDERSRAVTALQANGKCVGGRAGRSV